jgi:hypothetical protein
LAICWKLRASFDTRRASGSDKSQGADNQQERLSIERTNQDGSLQSGESSETARQAATRNEAFASWMIQSDLHSDMQEIFTKEEDLARGASASIETH